MGTLSMNFGQEGDAGPTTQRRGRRKLLVGLRKDCGGNAENIDLPRSQRFLERVEWTQRKLPVGRKKPAR